MIHLNSKVSSVGVILDTNRQPVDIMIVGNPSQEDFVTSYQDLVSMGCMIPDKIMEVYYANGACPRPC